MRLERISIGGVLRFTDPVTVDLASLPAGLVAVVGENGSGKTTLVEAPIAALFRSFPSRDGRPLVDYATTRDAFLEAVFTVDAGRYRARVNLDGQRRAADAVLEHTAADGMVTLLNDGKLSTYDEAIARVFPPRDLLLASAVAAQNRAGSFVTLDKRGRKELFGRLLGLDRFEAMSTTAKAAAARCEAMIGTLGVKQRLLAPEAADGVRQTIEGEAQRAVAGAASTAAERAQVESDRSGLLADRDRLRDDASAHDAAKTRLASLGSETAALLIRCQGLRRQQDAARAAAASEDGLLVENLNRQLLELTGRIQKNRALLERAEVVRSAAAELRAARETLAAREAEQLVLAAEPQRLLTEGAEAKAALSAVETAEAQLAQARRAASRLAGVCDVCTFVADARQAQASIPTLEAAVATKAACVARVEALRTQYREAEGRRLALVTLVDDARVRIAALEPDAQLLSRLEEAEGRITDLQRDRAVVVDQAEALRRGVAARLTTTVADLEAQYREAQATIDGHAAEVAAAQAEADRTATAAEGVADADRRLAYLDQQWQTLTADQARLQAHAEACESRMATWRVKATQQAEVERQLAEIYAEWRDWQLLARALGRDGLPVLEIDAAGPTVSAYTNDLLAVCFGPRFTVELITQAAKADGKGTKEVFELQVLDNLRGGAPRDLADLSGGEQILVDEALKNALSLFINARHAGAVETMVRDETTGPLDPQNALRYVEMLRRVRTIGHVRHVLFVSHNPVAAAMADVQLQLADGHVTVVYPPFSEAA
jgi:exonuclease SbcC